MTGHGADRGGVTITLPMTPDRRLAPNRMYRGHGWKARAALIAAEREKAGIAAHHHSPGLIPDWEPGTALINEPVTVTVTIHWGKSLKAGKSRARIEQDRRLDWDSATALVKPLCDGALVDTGVLADDRLIEAGTVYQDVDPEGRGFTVITITPAREQRARMTGEDA